MNRRAFLKLVVAVPLAVVGLSQSLRFVPRYYEASVTVDREDLVFPDRKRKAILGLLERDMEEASNSMLRQLQQMALLDVRKGNGDLWARLETLRPPGDA